MDSLLSLFDIYEEFIFFSSLLWPFLLGTVIVSAWVYWVECSSRPKNLRDFWRWLFPKSIYSHQSSQLDFKFVLLNTGIYGLFFSAWLLSAEAVAESTSSHLQLWVGVRGSIPEGYFWPSITLTFALFLALDFSFFIAHWLQHKIPFLWRFHRVHHSAEVLNPLTAFRQHPVDQLFEGSIVGLVTGFVGGFFHYYFLGLADTLSFMGFNFLTFCFYALGAHLRHSHIRLGYPKWLSCILISPLQHQVHHSYLDVHRNKNFGGVFAFWDLWFKSLYFPNKNETITVGVKDGHPELTKSILGLYFSPFRNLIGIDLNSLATKAYKFVTRSRRVEHE